MTELGDAVERTPSGILLGVHKVSESQPSNLSSEADSVKDSFQAEAIFTIRGVSKVYQMGEI